MLVVLDPTTNAYDAAATALWVWRRAILHDDNSESISYKIAKKKSSGNFELFV
jgi:hypothetical protein